MQNEKHVSLPGTRREIGYRQSGFAAIDLFASLVANRSFIATVARRDLLAKYRGAFIGVLWMVGTPAALVLAYGFMTIGVFQMRETGSGAIATFITLWFCISLWQAFSEAVGRSASIVSDNASLVKRSPFPLSALPPAVVVTSFMGLAISLCLGVLAQVVFVGVPPPSWLLLVVVLPAFSLSTLAFVYLVATIGAFSKDIRYVLPLGLTVSMLMTPVLYPASKVPSSLTFLAAYNPFTPVFETVRTVVSGGTELPAASLAVVTGVAFVSSILAYALFRARSVEFADVL